MTGYDIEKHYDRIANAYNKFESYNPRKHILIGAQFKKIMGDLSGYEVMDLGCGSGFFSRLSAQAGAKAVLGIDISGKQIKFAKNKGTANGKIKYIKGNVLDLAPKRKFDAIVSGYTFSYASSMAELQKYASISSKSLKPGGKLFAVICNPENPLREDSGLYEVTQEGHGKLKDGSKLRCEFFDRSGKFLCHDYKFFLE